MKRIFFIPFSVFRFPSLGLPFSVFRFPSLGLPFSVFLFSVSVHAGPAVLQHGLIVSNGITVESGALLVRDGTNLVPVLKAGDVSNIPVRVDGFTVVTDSVGRLSLPARFDLNDALFAWRLSLLEGSALGMIDSWFWPPVSLVGLAEPVPGNFISGRGIQNYDGGPGLAISLGGSDYGYTLTNVPTLSMEYTIQAWVKKNSPMDSGFFVAGLGTWDGHAQGIALVGFGTVWQFSQWNLQLSYGDSDGARPRGQSRRRAVSTSLHGPLSGNMAQAPLPNLIVSLISKLRCSPRGKKVKNQRPRTEMPPSRDNNEEPCHALRRALRDDLRNTRQDQTDKYAVDLVVLATFHAQSLY